METIFRKREKALISLAYYISKLLGKSTIDKKSSGETRGRQGSSSRNYDVLGREIMMPDEVRKMDNKKCLVFIRGFDPVLDNKFMPPSHKMFAQTADGGGSPYKYNAQAESGTDGQAFTILNSNSLKYYESLKEKGEEVYIDTLSYEDLQWFGQENTPKSFMDYATGGQEMEENSNKDTGNIRQTEKDGTISARILNLPFTKEQKNEAALAIEAKVPKEVILSYFYPETPASVMAEYRKKYGQG